MSNQWPWNKSSAGSRSTASTRSSPPLKSHETVTDMNDMNNWPTLGHGCSTSEHMQTQKVNNVESKEGNQSIQDGHNLVEAGGNVEADNVPCDELNSLSLQPSARVQSLLSDATASPDVYSQSTKKSDDTLDSQSDSGGASNGNGSAKSGKRKGNKNKWKPLEIEWPTNKTSYGRKWEPPRRNPFHREARPEWTAGCEHSRERESNYRSYQRGGNRRNHYYGNKNRMTPMHDDVTGDIAFYVEPDPITDPTITSMPAMNIHGPTVVMPSNQLGPGPYGDPSAFVTPFIPPYVPMADSVYDSETIKKCIKQQTEYYFCEENLQKDFFLRRKMDPDGYLPISLIASFHRVQALTNDVALIIETLQGSEMVELNATNSKIRLKFDPLKWRLSDQNAMGNLCPLESTYCSDDAPTMDSQPVSKSTRLDANVADFVPRGSENWTENPGTSNNNGECSGKVQDNVVSKAEAQAEKPQEVIVEKVESYASKLHTTPACPDVKHELNQAVRPGVNQEVEPRINREVKPRVYREVKAEVHRDVNGGIKENGDHSSSQETGESEANPTAKVDTEEEGDDKNSWTEVGNKKSRKQQNRSQHTEQDDKWTVVSERGPRDGQHNENNSVLIVTQKCEFR